MSDSKLYWYVGSPIQVLTSTKEWVKSDGRLYQKENYQLHFLQSDSLVFCAEGKDGLRITALLDGTTVEGGVELGKDCFISFKQCPYRKV